MSTTTSADAKLQTLAESEGFSCGIEMITARGVDSVFPGICMNRGCDYTAEVEGDQEEGECESCGTGTVKSGLVLAGMI
jgi:hypothetical protein